MSLNAEELSSIVKIDRPVLCVDTCIFLDIIRDLTSESTTPSNARAAISLLEAATFEQDLTILIAEQVSQELQRNRAGVGDLANKALKRFVKAAARMHEVAQIYGAQGVLQASHLEGHVDRAQTVLDGWIQAAVTVPENSSVLSRAAVRSMKAITPAKIGSNSIADCVVIEAYLEAANHLRKAGQTRPIVFVSSNTADFTDRSGSVPQNLAVDLSAAGLVYQPNLGAAKHALGL